MSDTRLSAVASWSYDGVASAYRFARHVLQPNPQAVLWLFGGVLVVGTIASMGYLVTGNASGRLLTQPVQLGAVAVLYGIDLLAIYTVGKMIRQISPAKS